MSRSVVIRYRTRPEAADENARLVEAVFASLAEAAPPDFRYTTYRLADGATFVHVARFDTTGNPLASLPAFVEFQRELEQRCVEQPAPSEATVVGSYGWRS
ncbi:MAG: hypothetical protein ACHQNA_09270 [Acidimicrobiales bacterium]